MGLIQSALRFFGHLVHARRWDSFHSPYLFELFTYASDDKIQDPRFERIEEGRRSLMRSAEKIERIDFGAGSVYQKIRSEVTIADVAKSALSKPFQCRFISRMVRFSSSQMILEFGTSLGISSAYLAAGTETGKVTTIEGDPSIAKVARNIVGELGLLNIDLVNKKFEDFIRQDMHRMSHIDFLFIDGNHRKENLLTYYHSLKPLFRRNTIVIVDDIYWSSDMHKGWKELISQPEITQSVDCFQFGVLFFNPHFLNKQNHIIRLPFKTFR